MARQRIHNMLVTETVTMRTMLVSVLVGGGEANAAYKRLLERLQG